MKLYHGSPVGKITEITDSGVFDGIFASTDLGIAESHGDIITEIELTEAEIMTNLDFFNLENEEIEKIKEELKTEYNEKYFDSAVFDDDDSGVWDDEDIENKGELSWEYQRVRGQAAKILGYKAVECRDEHGTTYLLNSNCKI